MPYCATQTVLIVIWQRFTSPVEFIASRCNNDVLMSFLCEPTDVSFNIIEYVCV